MINRIPFWFRPFMLFALVLGTYFFVSDPARRLEAALVGSLGSTVSDRIVGLGSSTTILVRSNDGLFAADVARGCSSAVAMSVVVGIALLLTSGTTVARLRASMRAVIFVAVANLIRLFLIVLAGSYGGTGVLALAHDLIGTTLAYMSLAYALYLLARDSVRQEVEPPLVMRKITLRRPR